MVLFLTDILIYCLLVIAVSFFIYARRHEHLRGPWREVGRSGVAMGALVVLSFYVVIGLLDSIHFNPQLKQQNGSETVVSNKVLSVFDYLVGPLRTQRERTYSAPFATHAYSKDSVEQSDGRTSRQYPKLIYGGAHLSHPEQRLADIFIRTLTGMLLGLLLWGLVTGLFIWWRARSTATPWREAAQQIFRGDSPVRWRSALFTLLTMLVLGFVFAMLATKYHIFGTDKVGEDVFYQSLKSVRTGLVIGTLTTLVMLPFAVMLGIMAGYFGGWVDDVIQYIYTTLNSIPGVLLIAAVILTVQVILDNQSAVKSLEERADLRLLWLCLILGVTSWTGLCRYLRGESLKLREIDYIQAAQSLGVRDLNIITRHILPNVMHIVLITVVLDFSGLVLAEAVLSYVEIGVDPTMNSWGNMINSARLEMARDPVVWWSLAAAFVFMFTLVLAANLFSDAVRDAFDPRLRGSRS